MTYVSEMPFVEMRGVSKAFGPVEALQDVSLQASQGEVTCLLGDNGAGKSTLIQILAGVHRPDSGEVLIDGEPVDFASPREALAAGVSTVFQDLAMIPLMSIVRNFFLGQEPIAGIGPLRVVKWQLAEEITRAQLAEVGIALRDARQAVGTLSGGERQSVAIARALYFGAKVLILDEPTSALGVREAANVLTHIAAAADSGLAVVFITHNVAHAWAAADRFVVLNRGRVQASFARGEASREELQAMMAGGEELDELTASIQRRRGNGA